MMPNPYMILAAALILVASFGGGYYKGYSAEHTKFLAFQEQVKTTARVQEAKNESVVKQAELVTDGVKNEYEARLAALRSYYARRVQQPSTGSGNVSSVSSASAGANGSTSDPEFVGRCAATTAQLVSLQEWIRKIK